MMPAGDDKMSTSQLRRFNDLVKFVQDSRQFPIQKHEEFGDQLREKAVPMSSFEPRFEEVKRRPLECAVERKRDRKQELNEMMKPFFGLELHEKLQQLKSARKNEKNLRKKSRTPRGVNNQNERKLEAFTTTFARSESAFTPRFENGKQKQRQLQPEGGTRFQGHAAERAERRRMLKARKEAEEIALTEEKKILKEELVKCVKKSAKDTDFRTTKAHELRVQKRKLEKENERRRTEAKKLEAFARRESQGECSKAVQEVVKASEERRKISYPGHMSLKEVERIARERARTDALKWKEQKEQLKNLGRSNRGTLMERFEEQRRRENRRRMAVVRIATSLLETRNEDLLEHDDVEEIHLKLAEDQI